MFNDLSQLMTQQQRKCYATPIVKRYGAIEEITKAVIWPGSGDILSQIVEEHSEHDVEDGCPSGGIWAQFCTGS